MNRIFRHSQHSCYKNNWNNAFLFVLNYFYIFVVPDSLTFTRLATNGPAPPPRLDFAMNLIEITLPTMQQSKNCLPSAKASEESKGETQ